MKNTLSKYAVNIVRHPYIWVATVSWSVIQLSAFFYFYSFYCICSGSKSAWLVLKINHSYINAWVVWFCVCTHVESVSLCMLWVKWGMRVYVDVSLWKVMCVTYVCGCTFVRVSTHVWGSVVSIFLFFFILLRFYKIEICDIVACIHSRMFMGVCVYCRRTMTNWPCRTPTCSAQCGSVCAILNR